MKLPCKIIEDLLPLYEEGICSEETREVVEQHLNECEKCRKIYKEMQEIPKAQFESPKSAQDKAMKKGLKKIKKHWICSIVFVIILIPLSYLGYNEVTKRGVHFTNIRELYIGNQFLKELQEGDYEGAFQYLNIRDKKIQFRPLGTKKLENFEEKAYEVFIESAKGLQDIGGIQEFEYAGIISYIAGNKVEYAITYNLKGVDGKDLPTTEFNVSDNGVDFFGTNNPYSTDPISYLGMWGEWLWEDLNGCYWDLEAKEYVYY